MDSINISLPPAMAEFARRQAEQNYGNVSEFFRALLRERMQREIDADLAFLESTSAGAPAGPSETDIGHVLDLQKKVRKARRARRI
ncbi:MAG: hypothetical protein ABSH38_20075 [Verrucomicrobiota bacterium]